jgi:radical SAM protein with 4Fe4S-binding SPASM domain
VWREAEAIVALRARQAIPLTRFAPCDACGYLDYCTGNCPALAYSGTGEVDRPSPDGCLYLHLQEGGTIP